jgi:hypothetical protein
MIQERFDQTINLIKKQGENYCFFQKLLAVHQSTALIFSFFRKPSQGNSRQNVLAAYRLRAALLKNRKKISDYTVLIDRLNNAKVSHICISVFITGDGTYTIFSDFDAKEMIGALFVPAPPEEVPAFSHLFMNGSLLSRERS